MATGSAFADINSRGVFTVAEAFGLTVPENPTKLGIGPCPACGAPTRHTQTNDKRGAIGPRRDGLGWKCFQCDASGDAVALAAYCVLGKVPGRGSGDWKQVLSACAEHGLCEGPQTGTPTPRRPYVKPAPRPAPPPPARPPRAEVEDLWSRCAPVTDDEQVRDYLRGRNFNQARLDAIAALDLARALPRDGALPAWAQMGQRDWRARGYRLVFPLVNADGAVESLNARHLGNATPKYLAATGYEMRELVGANPEARRMLAGQHRPQRLVITEGMTDYLKAATDEAVDRPAYVPVYAAIERLRHHGATNTETDYPPGYCFLCGLSLRPDTTRCDACDTAVRLWADSGMTYNEAVLTVFSGSWSNALAAHVPAKLEAILVTDNDEAGESYARTIAATLTHCVVSRLKIT